MDREIHIGNTVINISILDLLIILYFGRISYINFGRAFGISTKLIAILVMGSFLILFFIYTLQNYKTICWDGILLILFLLVFFKITIYIHPEYSDRFKDIYFAGRYSAAAVFDFGASIYCYYLIRLFEKYPDELYKIYHLMPYIIFIFNIGRFINHDSEYQMEFGYQMEMAAILFLARYLYEEKSRTYLLALSIFSMLLGILYGSRACIVGYVVFSLLFCIWRGKASIKQLLLLILGAIVAITYNSSMAMDKINTFLLSKGFESRTLSLIASGDILAADTARQDRIWPVLIDYLKSIGIFTIPGAFTDRFLIDPHYPYAHNIVLEILVTFGKFWGSLILLCILFFAVKNFLKNKNVSGLLLLVFGTFSICRLAVSNSFWIEPYFWAFLAMLKNCNSESMFHNQIQIKWIF